MGKLTLSSIIILLAIALTPRIYGDQVQPQPRYLYKVVSLDEWTASQKTEQIPQAKGKSDIQLNKIDQLENTILRDYSNAPEVIILEIDTERLKGPVSSEPDPDGKVATYHYAGAIPLSAISEPRIIHFR